MNYFLKALCILLLLSLASPVRAQQAFAPTNANDCTLAFFTALADKDAAALRSLMTMDFSMVSFDGRLIDGAALSEALASGYITIERGDVSGTYTRLYGDAGLTTGTWEARGSLQGYTFRNHISFMAVCVRQGGRWKLAGMQLTPQP